MTKELERLIKANRIVESLVLFGDTPERSDFETLHLVLTDLLPQAVASESAWLIRNQKYLDALVEASQQAMTTGYHPAKMSYYLAHLHCYRAIALVLERKTKEAQTELLRAAGKEDNFEPPEQPIKSNPTRQAMEEFFDRVFSYFRDHGYEEVVSQISWIIERVVVQFDQDEHRTGVARGLFLTSHSEGVVRLVLVALEDGEGIEYQHVGPQELGEEIKQAARAAFKVADAWLRSMSYPEGLAHQKVLWQIVKPEGIVDSARTIYDGASLGLALTMAILSGYLRQVLPCDVAFTGALDLHSAQDGHIIGVSGVYQKVVAATNARIRQVYLPIQNEIDIDLSAAKAAEGQMRIRPVRTLASVTGEVFSKAQPKSFGALLADLARTTLSQFGLFRGRMPAVAYECSGHILLSSGLFAAIFFLEGANFHFVYRLLPAKHGMPIVIGAAMLMFVTGVVSYSLPLPLMTRGNRQSWVWMNVILGAATAVCAFLFLLLVPLRSIDTGPVFDWPPPLAMFKDLVVVYAFAFLFMTNFYCFIIANEFLKERRQFYSLKRSIAGDPAAIGCLPITVFYISFRSAVMTALVAGIILLSGELYYFYQLREELEQVAFIIGFGLIRDALLVLLAVKVLLWYQIAQTRLSAFR